jgi:hypothetical protein
MTAEQPDIKRALLGLFRSPELFCTGIRGAENKIDFLRLGPEDYSVLQDLSLHSLMRNLEASGKKIESASVDLAGLLDLSPSLPEGPQGPGLRLISFIQYSSPQVLLSILEKLPGTFCLSEPSVLQDLAVLKNQATSPNWTSWSVLAARLLARTFNSADIPIIKSQRFDCAALHRAMLDSAGARSVFTHIEFADYFAKVFLHRNSGELELRLVRELLSRGSFSQEVREFVLRDLTPARATAADWVLTQQAFLESVSGLENAEYRTFNSHRFYADPVPTVYALAKYLGVEAGEGVVENIFASKEFDYFAPAAQARKLEVEKQLLTHPSEYQSACQWLEEFKSTFGIPEALPHPLV